MVIHDPAMTALMSRVERVAPSGANVLITGESGTGKDLVAARLHHSSGRGEGAFVVLNCAALSDSLLDSELFGHRAGPDDASPEMHGSIADLMPAGMHAGVPRKMGKLETASGGTLLFDEIGEMDLRMQAKVLRALQQREARPACRDDRPDPGDVRKDVRIVATTSMDLHEAVRLGRFRSALLFRLNVITIKVPPLRDRPAEIPVLAEVFARTFARTNALPVREVSADALAVLLRHRWPGNVRELENVMHRAVLTETGPAISPSSLDIELADIELAAVGQAVIEPGQDTASRLTRCADEAAAPEPPAVPQTFRGPASRNPPVMDKAGPVHTAGRTIEAVEKDMILDTLSRCMGNRSQTAAVLGISIRTLRNKLHEYERSGTRIPRPVVVAVA